MKLLILGSFPAPYRIEVFRGLAKEFDADVFFETNSDQNRNSSYFVGKDQFEYYLMTEKEDARYFKACIKNINEYDLVIAYDWYRSFALHAILHCKLKKIPYAINCDGAFVDHRSSAIGFIKSSIKRLVIQNASLCFASGDYASKYYSYYGAKNSKIKKHKFTSLSTEDLASAKNQLLSKTIYRMKIGLSEKKTVLSIGQFIHRKGFDILLSAWEEFDNDYQLIIIGGGELKGEFEKYILEKKYGSVFLIDYVPKEIISDYFAASDLFVLPTREDIWGLVINEAMAYGLPIISSDRCIAALELVENGVNGYIVESNNINQLREKIRQCITNDQLADEFSENNILKIQGSTYENLISSHISNIKELIFDQ